MEIAKKIDEIKNKFEVSKCKYWWHYFLAVSEKTGEEKPFFIEHYVVNPELSSFKPNFSEPSYAMVRAGTWDNGGIQVSNFYGGTYFNIRNYNDESQIVIGHCVVSDKYLKGKVYLSKNCAKSHNEFMCDCGNFSWEIQKHNRVSDNIENNIINITCKLERFNTEYSGHIVYNGEKYRIKKSIYNSYEIKANIKMDIDFCLNINCTSFKNSSGKNEEASLKLTSISPSILKKVFNKEFSLIFKLGTKEYKYCSMFFENNNLNKLDYKEEENKICMNLKSCNNDSKIEIYFEEPKSNMMKLFYSNLENHKSIIYFWNSFYSKIHLKLYEKHNEEYVLKDIFEGDNANIICYEY